MIQPLRRALGARQARAVTVSIVLTTAAAVLHGLVVAALVPVLTRLLGPDPTRALPWTWTLVALAAGYVLVRAAALTLSMRVGGSVSRGLHHRLAEHVARLPVGWFTGARLGELTHLATAGVQRCSALPVHVLPPLIDAVVTPLVALVALAYWDWRLAAAGAVALVALAAVHSWAGRRVDRDDAARDAIAAEATDRALEHARAQQVLRTAGRADDRSSELDRSLRAQHAASRRLLRTAVPALFAYSGSVRLVLTALVALVVHRTLAGALDGPTAVGLLVLVVRLVQPVSAAAEHGAALRATGRLLTGLRGVLDAAPLPEPACPAVPADGTVDFDGVRFGYAAGAVPALDHVDLHAEPGTLTAVVGASGAGKSTVTTLLARFHDVDAGAVRIGGIDVRAIGSRELARHVALVPQEVYLFDTTVADNVRVAAPRATDEELDRVAARCGLDTVVAELPQGWHTRVGEGGTSLSGGQRQRVAIARALLTDAPVVVLDEATSALDAAHEALLARTARQLAREGRTVLAVAHRPATVAVADQVVVLERGRVVERGRPGDLARAGGPYARLLDARRRARGWRLVPTPPTTEDHL